MIKTSCRFPFFWILCSLMLAFTSGEAQDLLTGAVNPSQSWGSYNRESGNIFRFHDNKAVLAGVDSAVIGVCGERPFMIPELFRFSVVGIIPAGAGSFGLCGATAGSDGIRELAGSLSYGRVLTKQLDLGIEFGYKAVSVPGYEAIQGIWAEAGILLHLNDKVDAGWNVHIPMSRTDHGSTVPVTYRFGIGFNPPGDWSAAADLEKYPDRTLNGRIGFIYRANPAVALKAGFTTKGPPCWFGFGFNLRIIRLDISASMHNRLGLTPAIAVTKQITGAGKSR